MLGWGEAWLSGVRHGSLGWGFSEVGIGSEGLGVAQRVEAWLRGVQRGLVEARQGSEGWSMAQLGWGMAQLWGGVAQRGGAWLSWVRHGSEWRGVDQWIARRTAFQANQVLIPTRHPLPRTMQETQRKNNIIVTLVSLFSISFSMTSS